MHLFHLRSRPSSHAQRTLKAWEKIRRRLPAHPAVILTRDDRRIPMDYHAANLLIRRRNLPLVRDQVIKGRLHYTMSRNLQAGRDGRFFVTFGELLHCLCDAFFYYDFDGNAPHRRDEFGAGLERALPVFLAESGRDPDRKIDVTFLRETFRRILMIGEGPAAADFRPPTRFRSSCPQVRGDRRSRPIRTSG